MVFKSEWTLPFILGYVLVLALLIALIGLVVGAVVGLIFRLRGARRRAIGAAYFGWFPGVLVGYFASLSLGLPVLSFLAVTATGLVGAFLGSIVGLWLLLLERQYGNRWRIRALRTLTAPFRAVGRGVQSIGRSIQRRTNRRLRS